MSSEVFAEWLKRQGHRVYETHSSKWVNTGPKILQSFPYFLEIQPDLNENKELLRKSKAIALRYSTPISASEGQISYHVFFEGNDFSLRSLPKKVRHDVQHGLDYCEYEQISIQMMEEQGWRLREETLIRQGRQGAETKKWWSNLCRSAEGLPGFEMWGATRENKLVASILTFIDNGTASILYQQSLTEHLKYGINNTLAYVYVNNVLKNKKAEKIFYGLHSLDAPSSVDEFKFRMGFVAKPVRQRVIFNPLVAPLFNNLTYTGVKSINSLLKGNYFFDKSEGMLRFYLQGKRPLAEQEWPEVLLEQKETILAQMNQT
ncbi:MAG: hypothetical protein WA110_08105 [Anaerolineaceae bacterium]